MRNVELIITHYTLLATHCRLLITILLDFLRQQGLRI